MSKGWLDTGHENRREGQSSTRTKIVPVRRCTRDLTARVVGVRVWVRTGEVSEDVETFSNVRVQ